MEALKQTYYLSFGKLYSITILSSSQLNDILAKQK